MDWGWLPSAGVSGLAALFAGLGYRLQRRHNVDVKWAARIEERTDMSAALVVTNRGVTRARDVTIEVEPRPRSAGEGGTAPQDVDLGADVRVGWSRPGHGTGPRRVTVRWRQGRFGRKVRSWTSDLPPTPVRIRPTSRNPRVPPLN